MPNIQQEDTYGSWTSRSGTYMFIDNTHNIGHVHA